MSHSRSRTVLSRKSDTQWVDGALVLLVDAMQHVEGLISLYVQYRTGPALVVALVESEDARRAVRAIEDRLFDAQPFLPVDLHVDELVDESERPAPPTQNGFARLWARTTADD